MVLGQIGQGAMTAFANELAVGDNGPWMLLSYMGTNKTIQVACPILQGIPCRGYIQITPKI